MAEPVLTPKFQNLSSEAFHTIPHVKIKKGRNVIQLLDIKYKLWHWWYKNLCWIMNTYGKTLSYLALNLFSTPHTCKEYFKE